MRAAPSGLTLLQLIDACLSLFNNVTQNRQMVPSRIPLGPGIRWHRVAIEIHLALLFGVRILDLTCTTEGERPREGLPGLDALPP